MVSICEDLHSYVPTDTVLHTMEVPGETEHFEVTSDHFHYTLIGKWMHVNVCFKHMNFKSTFKCTSRWGSTDCCQSAQQQTSQKQQ